ncbi:MAG: nucleotide pyrophosphatase, partial [Candidatus Thorarchaeota archaeon]
VEEIIDKLEKLSDSKTGRKPINKAYKREEIYNGNYIENAPDIIIGFNPGYRMSWQTAIGGFTKDIIMDNTKKWNGDHLVDPKFVPGVLFSNVKLGGISASQIDVTPTVLDALEIEIPKEIDGKSLLR